MERLDIGRSFTFMFEDPEWVVKLILGALVFLVGLVFSVVLIGVLAFFVLTGYMVQIVRNVSRGEELPLPAWSDFGNLFTDGLRVGVALFVWMLPLLFAYMPIMILMILTAGPEGSSDAVGALVALTMLVCGCFVLLYGILFALVTPVIILRVAEEQSIAAAFQFGEIFDTLRSFLGPIVLVVIALLVAQFLASLVGTLLCGVGILVTGVWVMWVEGHLIGQLGRMMRGSQEVVASAGV